MENSKFEYVRIAQAIEYISTHIQEQPSLEEIAHQVHISPFHLQRLFTDWAGVSPKKFLQYLTLQYAKDILSLNSSPTLSEATSMIGLSSTSRLHDLFVKIEGMTPNEFQNKGRNLTIKYSLKESQFGKYLVASTGKGISNLYFFDQDPSAVLSELKSCWINASIKEGEDSDQLKIEQFFLNDLTQTDKIKLHLKATPFQIKVWEALLKIPQGYLSSYHTIAKQIKQPTASRAVGTAIGSNPIGFIIPCHRVIKSAGGIGEFRWGSTRKKAMIAWEASQREL
jgi:AraC family transcriptional regulator of adaptative response/methylated-DNA-[protein]-cysteine methyltransferase